MKITYSEFCNYLDYLYETAWKDNSSLPENIDVTIVPKSCYIEVDDIEYENWNNRTWRRRNRPDMDIPDE